MAGTETGIKYLQRKLKGVGGSRSGEGTITQTDASQGEGAQSLARLGSALEGDKAREAAWNQRLNAAADYNDAVEADAKKAKGKKKGGTIRSASSRADGIAVKGKTRGKMY